jgi:hypothetical protein
MFKYIAKIYLKPGLNINKVNEFISMYYYILNRIEEPKMLHDTINNLIPYVEIEFNSDPDYRDMIECMLAANPTVTGYQIVQK